MCSHMRTFACDHQIQVCTCMETYVYVYIVTYMYTQHTHNHAHPYKLIKIGIHMNAFMDTHTRRESCAYMYIDTHIQTSITCL